ncbi:UNVERIFIED_CONTAM: Grn [Trichonephila clavipes]
MLHPYFFCVMDSLAALVLLSFIIGVFGDCETNSCKPTETCCPLSVTGGWSCCPYADAVCCSNGTHCCPKRTFCHEPTGACFPETDFLVTDFFPADVIQKRRGIGDEHEFNFNEMELSPCDQDTWCPPGYLCCQMIEGDYGCCPHKGSDMQDV